MDASSRRLRAFAVLFLAAHVGCTADVPNPPAALGQLRDVDDSESYVASVHDGSLVVTPLAGGDPIIVADGNVSKTIFSLEGSKLADRWFVGRSSVLVYSQGPWSGRTLGLWKPGFDRGVAIGSDDLDPYATSDGAYLAFFDGALPNIRLRVVRTADCTSAGCAPAYTLGQSGYGFSVSLAKGGRLLYWGDGDFAAYLLDIDSGVTTRELDDASSGAVLSPDGSTLIWMDPSTKALYAKDLDAGTVEPWAAPTTPWTSRAGVLPLEPIYSDHVVVADSPDANTLVEYVCSRASCTEISRSCILSCPPSPEDRYCVASIDANGAASSIVCGGVSPWGGSVAVLDADGKPEFEWSSSIETLELTVSDDGSRYVGQRGSTGSANVDIITGAMPPSSLDASTAVGRYALSDYVRGFNFVPGSSQFVFATYYGPAQGYWWTGTSVRPLGLLATNDSGPGVLARAGHVYWSAPDGVRRLPVPVP